MAKPKSVFNTNTWLWMFINLDRVNNFRWSLLDITANLNMVMPLHFFLW